jgi:hypothetical protein
LSTAIEDFIQNNEFEIMWKNLSEIEARKGKDSNLRSEKVEKLY